MPEPRLAIRDGRKVVFVGIDEIDWIEAEDYYVRIHAGGQSYLLRESLTRLEGRLDPASFVRVHRSAIVRISRVKELVPLHHGDAFVVLKGGTRVRVSRSRRGQVDERLGLR